jgi:hypothetical protein
LSFAYRFSVGGLYHAAKRCQAEVLVGRIFPQRL